MAGFQVITEGQGLDHYGHCYSLFGRGYAGYSFHPNKAKAYGGWEIRAIILAGHYMSPSPKLTDEEKQNGKRAVLIPSKDIQEKMHPITRESFTRLVKRAIPPSPQPDPAKT